jgi:hypothetical protein
VQTFTLQAGTKRKRKQWERTKITRRTKERHTTERLINPSKQKTKTKRDDDVQQVDSQLTLLLAACFTLVSCGLLLTLKMEERRSSEMSVGVQRHKRRCTSIIEDRNFHNHRCQNMNKTKRKTGYGIKLTV